MNIKMNKIYARISDAGSPITQQNNENDNNSLVNRIKKWLKFNVIVIAVLMVRHHSRFH